jgi:prepilin-type N-terminal cleavage/methylation domain-containing protein
MVVETQNRQLSSDARRGFTLIELLVVVAIIALLISILLPSLNGARDNAKTAVCKSNQHQITIANSMYQQENEDRIAHVRMKRAEPRWFIQYDSIRCYWKYFPDLKIYQCPSAKNETSVKYYDTEGANDLGNGGSWYVFRVTDDPWKKFARPNNWFPGLTVDTSKQLIPEIYTEYWLNDWQPADANGNPKDRQGNPVPGVSGCPIGKIPFPALTVIVADACTDRPILRHARSKAQNFAFIDGHSESIERRRFRDTTSIGVPHDQLNDKDTYGNRPYWSWGLTRGGFDGDINVP